MRFERQTSIEGATTPENGLANALGSAYDRQMTHSPVMPEQEIPGSRPRERRVISILGDLDPLVDVLSTQMRHAAEFRRPRSISSALSEAQNAAPTLFLLTEETLHQDRFVELSDLAHRKLVPMVFVVRSEAGKEAARRHGAADYFVRPLDFGVVSARLEGLLEWVEGGRVQSDLHQARWQLALEGASLGVWEHDLQSGQVAISEALRSLLGLRAESKTLSEESWLDLIHAQDRLRVVQARDRLRSGAAWENHLEYRFIGSERRVIWAREAARVLQRKAQRPARLMGIIVDTTQQRASERRIVQLANFDDLTELPNRNKCLEFLIEAVERTQSTGDQACLIRVDISGLANINQTRGRPAGDQVLRQIATRLRFRASDPNKVSRIGGKEFALVVEQLDPRTKLAKAAEIAAQIAKSFSEPFEVSGELVTCAVHIGACVLPEEGREPEELLRKADIALTEAKHGGQSFAVFRRSMLKRVETREKLLRELQYSVFSGEIGLAYQPIVSGAGRLVGVEGLARWQHPTRGQIPAAEFIPLAIESGLIVPMGAALRRRACEQLAKWSQRSSTSDLVISLNVSPSEFEAESFTRDLILLVESMKLDPRKLQLELSESVLRGDRDSLETRFRALSNAGIRLSLDDFGTGLSSLTLLRKLPFEQLKLDRSFVSEMLTDPVNASLSRAILAMAQNLGLEVIAEGVEDETQARLLSEMGCNLFQGYLFGRPTDALTIETRASQDVEPLAPPESSLSVPASTTFEDEMDARILIVDDDATTLMLLGRILREYPNVRTTTSPLEAIKLVEERPPDLLLLDTQMPELNGFELWAALRNNPFFAEIPVVFVTALLDQETEIKALSMGAVDFVSKPISAARLKLAVRNQIRIKRQTDSLRQQASIDALTGVANRRSFDRALEREIARASEGSTSLALLMIDVDHFKFINDTFGHPAGDRCLISIGRILTHVVRRPVDVVARYGGEEFGVILPLVDGQKALSVAEEIVSEVRTSDFREDLGANHAVTVSVGWATYDGHTKGDASAAAKELLRDADEALLLAKEQGRNRVCGPEALVKRMRRISNQ